MTYKIVLIDDHPETLDIIYSVLSQSGYNVFSADSGLVGLKTAEEELPDLLIIDGQMPDIDGWEVCRRLRKQEAFKHTPIIMFSAVNVAEQKLAGFDAGADDYLTKPTEPTELLERVESLLEAVEPRNVVNSPNVRPNKHTQDIQIQEPLKTKHVSLKGSKNVMTASLPVKNNLIVVLGARGGVGTTTMAINLAASLSYANVPTTLIDLDLIQGHIALYLKQRVSRSINKLADLSAKNLKSQVMEAVIPYQKNLQLLLTRSNLLDQRVSLSVEQTMDLVNAVVEPGHCVVVDVGRGITAVTRPLIEQADQAILCLHPERVSLAAAKKLIMKWNNISLPYSDLTPIVFDFNAGRDIPKEAIERYLGESVQAVVPVQPQEFTHAVNKGMPLISLYKEGRTALVFRRLAQQLVR